MEDITRVLNEIADGDSSRQSALLEAIYAELRAMAAGKMVHERSGHTLQPTALVHEAYLRLVGNEQDWRNRRHFFGAASEAMRRILVDRARQRAAAKRGSGQGHVTLHEDEHLHPMPDERILEVHEALDQLEREDELKAQIVKLRFFVGLKYREIADLLELSEKTIRRHLDAAKIQLYRAINGPDQS